MSHFNTAAMPAITPNDHPTPGSITNRKVKIIVVGPNGGGVRKTKSTLAFGSVATAAGLKVLYICADRGIGSLSNSLKPGGPNRVELLPEEESADYATTLLALAADNGADVVIIDLGANEMLNSKSRRTVKAALRQLKELGHSTYVVLSLVPNKVGLEDDADNFARQMSNVAQVVLAIHGREEGVELAVFDELKEQYPSVEVPSDQLAILGLISAAGITHYDWCASPVPGYEIAAAWIAHNLLQLAKQPVMADIVEGKLAIPILTKLAERRPVTWYRNRHSRWQVRNECLAADAHEITSHHELLKLSADVEDAVLLAAARKFLGAADAAKAAHRSARRSG